ncbi:hypothetical protein [Leptospira sp. GIMC2001]|uniref:hypothetical protein n=1 Tax=Leptospira sp. GIMC2001 TaxID=1513297 RepID=UPI0023490C10|nr:hypothetical protein [Leptospira sp. GIMC2001]WCL49885.1 hypothetical protein O4O04_03445 [Leptospira sp. GIMC2001]
MQRFLFIIILVSSIGIYSQKQPSSPKEPSVPVLGTESLDSRGEPEQANKDSEPKKRDIRVTLCDGRKVSGKWNEKETEIHFTHIRDGIRYKKSIKTTEIQTVRLISWNAEPNKQEKEGMSYKMVPSKVWIQLKSGEKFDKDKGLEGTEYSIVTVENKNGSATLYTLWMDLLYKDGSWYSKLEKLDPKLERTDCHPDVIREIQFE